jgi:hypothetical protein
MNIIPVTPATLDIIEVLNGGVRPVIEDEETFFIFNGKDEHADIVTSDALGEIAPEWMAKIVILYRG